jgi:hypothetical protein
MRSLLTCYIPVLVIAFAATLPAAAQQKKMSISDDCTKECCSCEPRGGFYMGAEATFLVPLVDKAQFAISPGDGLTDLPPGFTVFDYGTDVDYLNAAPRLWLGYTSPSGWGIQGRYWQMTNSNDSAGTQIDPTLRVEGLSAAATSSLKLYTVDLEGTKDFCAHGWDMFGTFGVRHGSLEQHDAVVSQTFIGNGLQLDLYNQGATALRDFSGTGLTFSLAGSRSIGRHGCSVFWNARGSALWGESRAESATAILGVYERLVDFDFDATADRDRLMDDETLFIGEIQTGLRWEGDVRGFNARTFAFAAVEYQYWKANGGNADSAAFLVNTNPNNPVDSDLGSTVSTGYLDMSLIGFSLGAGFVY